MQSHDQVRPKAARDERVTAPASSRPKARKSNFKTETWYAAAAPKICAARKNISRDLEDRQHIARCLITTNAARSNHQDTEVISKRSRSRNEAANEVADCQTFNCDRGSQDQR